MRKRNGSERKLRCRKTEKRQVDGEAGDEDGSPPAAVAAAAAIPAAGVLMDLYCSVLKQACVSVQVGGEGAEKREQG